MLRLAWACNASVAEGVAWCRSKQLLVTVAAATWWRGGCCSDAYGTVAGGVGVVREQKTAACAPQLAGRHDAATGGDGV